MHGLGDDLAKTAHVFDLAEGLPLSSFQIPAPQPVDDKAENQQRDADQARSAANESVEPGQRQSAGRIPLAADSYLLKRGRDGHPRSFRPGTATAAACA